MSSTDSTAMETLANIEDFLLSAQANSYIEYTASSRVEAPLLMDRATSMLPIAQDIAKVALKLFTGYYQLAANIKLNIKTVDILGKIDPLNPNRKVDSRMLAGVAKRAHGAGTLVINTAKTASLASDDASSAFKDVDLILSDDLITPMSLESQGVIDDGIRQDINKGAQLSVGQIIKLTADGTNSSGDTVTVSWPISIRFMSSVYDDTTTSDILAMSSTKDSAKARYHKMRSGEIRFFKDWILNRDITTQHKKNLLNDHTGFYKRQLERVRQNQIVGATTMNPSVANYSAVYVISARTARLVEGKIKGQLSNFNAREKLFSQTYGMLLLVVDPDAETITTYHHSIKDFNVASFSDVKSSSKSDSGGDAMAVLNSLLSGRAPNI